MRRLRGWLVCGVFVLSFGAAVFGQTGDESSLQSASLQSGVSGVSDSVNRASDLENANSFYQRAHGFSDINLTNGSVYFGDTDLQVFGAGGMDIAVQRTYSSRQYKHSPNPDPFENKKWISGIGQGWGVSGTERAFVLQYKYAPNASKVVVESGSGTQEYVYSSSRNIYVSSNPLDFSTATVTRVFGLDTQQPRYQIEVTYPGGIKKTFAMKLFEEFWSGPIYNPGGTRLAVMIDHKIVGGYYLSKIETPHSSLTLSYELVEEKKAAFDWTLLNHVFGENTDPVEFNTAFQNGSFYFSNKRYLRRLKTVQNNTGKLLTFLYEGASNQSMSLDRPYMVTGLSAAGVNGQALTITYGIDSEGRLVSFKKGDLPATTYDYWKYEKTFEMYFIPIVYMGNREYYELIVPDYVGGSWATGSRAQKLSTDWGGADQYRGSLLSQVQTPFGSTITYSYEENMWQLQIKDHGMSQTRDYYGSIRINGIYVVLPHPQKTMPIVVKKTMRSGVEVNEHTFTYPGFSKKRNYQSYTVKGQKAPGIYFDRVVVTNPKSESETFVFDQGLLISHQQGNLEKQQTWDKDQQRLLTESSYKQGVLQTKMAIETYDAYHHPVRVVTQKGNVRTQIETQYVSDVSLINRGFIHLIRQQKTTDLNSGTVRIAEFDYNNTGNPIVFYEGSGASRKILKTLTYDAKGRVTSETSYGPWGQTTATTVYEALSTVYRVTQTVNGKSGVSEHSPYTGHLLKQIDANGLVVSHSYDSYGRLIKTVNPDGTAKNIAYSVDVKTTTVTALGLSSATLMDGFGRVVLIDKPTGLQDEKFEYYYAGLPSKVYRQENGVWVLKKSYTYDSYLRKTSTTSPDFGTTTYAYDTPQVNAMTVTDSQGRKTIQYQNEAGQTTKQNFSATGVSEDTVFSYNGFGQLLQTTDARGLTHSATYDNYGRLLQGNHVNSTGKRSEPIYSSAGAGIVTGTNIYDRAGALYRSYRYDYDNEGRITALKVDTMTKETTVYDTATNAKGMVASVENADAKTEYKYDTLGRLIEEKTTVKSANNRAMAIGYAYNSESALASISYPDGESIKYGYDTLKRVNAVSYGSTNKAIVGYTYNENGTIKSMQYGNGVKIAYTYERNMLLTKITVTNAQNAVLYSQDYRYDTPGKMMSTQHSNYFGGYAASHPSANVKRDYSYTAKDELAAVKLWEQPKYSYSYDANGNTKRYETAQNNGYTGDNMVIDTNEDKILQKTNKDGTRTGYSYDAMGNLNVKMQYAAGASGAPGGVSGATAPESPLPAGVSQRDNYVYNYQDQLSEVHRNGERIARYGYDTKRQRIYRQVYPTVAGGAAPPEAALREAKNGRLYMWDSAGRSIGEAEATTGRIVVRYIYSGNEKIAMERVDATTGARSWYYFINNAQGTPVLILDESGGTISRVNLDEWGNVGQLIGPASEVNYTGKKMDPETGLYYFNQRYYDPSLGRFLTEDPAGQGLNPYAYAGNSPLMYVDPDGEWFWLAGMIIGGVIGGWGKDLSKIETWGSIAMGAAVGAMAGAGLDYVAANAGLSVKVVADLPYVGQVNLASMDFVGPGLVAGGAGALAGRDQFRQDQFNAQERAHDMTGEFDSYYQTGVVESDFCYPCGGGVDDFVPRYGNWGGPGWSGANERPRREPVDSMDKSFKRHDLYYENNKEMYGDLVLLKELRALNSNPAKWAMPPGDIPQAIHYRAQAIDYFSMKVYGRTGQVW